MKLNDEISAKIAKSLLQIEAVRLNTSDPFTWASGIKSPIYCDNRKVLSYPDIRKLIYESMAKLGSVYFGQVDCVAGVATGGIAHGALVADFLNLPFVYVRSGKKEHGLGNLIEGTIKPGWRVLVIEDLVSTGQSSLSAVEAIKQNGCKVAGMIAIFTYGFDIADERFKKQNCDLITLTNYSTLIDIASKQGLINKNEIAMLEKWREDPHAWK